MEIWSILIFNVRRRIHMIILLQSVTIQFRRLFWHISYYKMRQSNFITKCDRLLLQSVSGITKCDRLYYKVRQVLQNVTVITKWDVTLLWVHGKVLTKKKFLQKLSSKIFMNGSKIPSSENFLEIYKNQRYRLNKWGLL